MNKTTNKRNNVGNTLKILGTINKSVNDENQSCIGPGKYHLLLYLSLLYLLYYCILALSILILFYLSVLFIYVCIYIYIYIYIYKHTLDPYQLQIYSRTAGFSLKTLKKYIKNHRFLFSIFYLLVFFKKIKIKHCFMLRLTETRHSTCMLLRLMASIVLIC